LKALEQEKTALGTASLEDEKSATLKVMAYQISNAYNLDRRTGAVILDIRVEDEIIAGVGTARIADGQGAAGTIDVEGLFLGPQECASIAFDLRNMEEQYGSVEFDLEMSGETVVGETVKLLPNRRYGLERGSAERIGVGSLFCRAWARLATSDGKL
jgi:hypothetical protein